MRLWRGVAVLVLAWPGLAAAQPVFFDDFDGNALLPHWSVPDPWTWEYNVSGGMLNVTGLFWPSNPQSPTNSAFMGALYEPQGDFQLDVRMGWSAGKDHGLRLFVGSTTGTGLADFGYGHLDWLSPDIPTIFAGASGKGVKIPAPPPGMHQFTVTRTSAQFDFYLDGELILTTFGSTNPAATISFSFEGPYPGQMNPLHIDLVQVVPAPGALALAIGPLAWAARRRRPTTSTR